MDAKKITSAALLGTAAMSLFSYLISEKEDKNFREPDVLAKLMENMLKAKSKEEMLETGWAAHIATGFVFTALFDLLWEVRKRKPGLISGLKAGAVSGVAGIRSMGHTV